MAPAWVISVVGESHRQETIHDLVQRSGRDNLKGELVPEPHNPVDPQAVKVVLQGKHVGYLSREMAARFSQVRNAPRRVYGRVVGGTPDKPSYGVLLDVPQSLYELLEDGAGGDEEPLSAPPAPSPRLMAPIAAPPAAAPVVIIQSGGPNIVVRALWFLLVGWWLGALVSGFAWVLNVTIIGLPVGLWLINRLPSVITLRPQGQGFREVAPGVLAQGSPQHAFWLRAAYFLLVGWWVSGLWMLGAYVLVAIVVGIPLAFWMFGRVGAVTTLHRS